MSSDVDCNDLVLTCKQIDLEVGRAEGGGVPIYFLRHLFPAVDLFGCRPGTIACFPRGCAHCQISTNILVATVIPGDDPASTVDCSNSV